MFNRIRRQLSEIVRTSMEMSGGMVPVTLEPPAHKDHGDLACSAALALAKVLKKNPMDIATDMAGRINGILDASPLRKMVVAVDVLRPGFINFRLAPDVYHAVLVDVFARGPAYGRTDTGAGRKVLVEFVSANPTGPLTVAHARQAAVGDVLVNILNFTGHHAQREFYVNDGGNQIRTLGRSVQLRILEHFGEKVEYPEDCYQGDYIRDMAKLFSSQRGFQSAADLRACAFEDICDFAKDHLMARIREDLGLFRVAFDNWSFESRIATPEKIARTLDELKAGGFIFEQDGALWFKSTLFGDDKDRVVKKSDGFYTYLAPDIVYHKDKYDRGFDLLVDILGPDHHGYIPRIKAAARALGRDDGALEVMIIQLATIFRDGKQLRMSTRAGEFISLREVIDEVGTDAGRYFMLMRQVSQQLEFDIDLAKKQAPDNPVYYIQYGHARASSLIRKAKDELSLVPTTSGFARLTDEAELDLIRKMLGFPECLDGCARHLDPFVLTRYMLEFALVFHKFYDRCRIMDPEDLELSAQRLGLTAAARIIIANGLGLLGITAPEKM